MESTAKQFATVAKPIAGTASDEPSKNSVATPARQADSPGVRVFSAQAVAAQRQQTLQTFARLKKARGAVKAARMVGCSITTLWRWQKQFAQAGLAGLAPQLHKCGRHSPFREIRLTAQAERELEKLMAQYDTPRLAWQQFALNPVCPPLIARQVQRTGKAPALLAGAGRLKPVSARVMISADGRRLFVKLPGQTAIFAPLKLPANFKPLEAAV